MSTDDGIRNLSADGIIMTGGWHLSYARVVLIEQDHDDAVVLVDGNGDGAELELEYRHRDVDGLWYCGSTAGHALNMCAAFPGHPATRRAVMVSPAGRTSAPAHWP